MKNKLKSINFIINNKYFIILDKNNIDTKVSKMNKNYGKKLF